MKPTGWPCADFARGQPVPGAGDQEEDDHLRGRTDAQQMQQVARANQIQKDDGGGKQQADQAFGEHGQRAGGGHAGAVPSVGSSCESVRQKKRSANAMNRHSKCRESKCA
jgi:hypothetical protein